VAAGKVFIGETGAGAPAPPPPPPPAEPKLQTAKWGQPGEIVNARWEKNRAKAGDKVKIIVDVKDFEDGTPAKFTIWEEDIDEENNFIAELDGVVKANKVEADWQYLPNAVVEDSTEEEGQPKYFFSVDIEGEEARSANLTFTYLLKIFLKDDDGDPLDDVPYTITLSDGTEKKGKFKNGWAEVQDAPFGNFFIEIEGYEITLE